MLCQLIQDEDKDNWPFRFYFTDLTAQQIQEIETWLKQSLKHNFYETASTGIEKIVKYRSRRHYFVFLGNKQDAMLFKMRWV
jgi:hypothetical protein